jgi:prefoldin alpha subunit
MKEEASRHLYLEYRAVSEQLQTVQQYLEQTAESMAEVAGVIAALDDLSQLRKGSRIFAPIANGIFVDATLNDSSSVRMNVGSGVVCQKPIAEAKLLLEQQRKELEELQARAAKERETLTARMREIEEQVDDQEKAGAEEATRSTAGRQHQRRG